MTVQTAEAVFSAQDTFAFTWATAFTGTYYVCMGLNISDGGGGIITWIDNASFGPAGFTINSSAPFSGHVYLLGFQP